MSEWKMEDMPLPALFDQARKIHSAASDSSVDQETLKRAIEALHRCDEMVSKLGLFSANETKNDVSTANLKYLLVPFYLGELTEKVAHGDRLQVIKISQDRFKEFISFCEVLELVPEEETWNSRPQGSFTPEARRALKISRFKRQKAAESRLQEIRERKERRGRSSKAAALSTPIEAGEEDALDDDGDEEREAWLTTISLAICKAFDMMEMLKKEEEMLSAVKDRQLKVSYFISKTGFQVLCVA
ncbi:PP2A regulatory subunit TAP46 [Acorus gramineus]|uniref:PP2A regulatory subunit TAP46 n=1 Tax=Acorus gramineus TaxID=55184 RepID=A0AAV9BEN1_ACOGR|nr:PP2A regulatory subunit TAP46 [Acorus gramineus]